LTRDRKFICHSKQ